MTVVVCFNFGITGAVMVADSRLSYRGPSGQIHTVRDVCQKIFPPTNWSLMGIAGNLCLGNALGEAVFNRLKATSWAEDLWLDHDDDVSALLHAVRRSHADFGPGHQGCVEEGAAILITWIGLINFNKADGTPRASGDRYERRPSHRLAPSSGSASSNSLSATEA